MKLYMAVNQSFIINLNGLINMSNNLYRFIKRSCFVNLNKITNPNIVIIAVFMLSALSITSVNAQDCTVTCPSSSLKIMEKENIFNKITGVNFTSKKIAETIIQKEINEELNSKVSANLEIFNVKRLKKGEFKSLTLKSKNIKYKAFSMSDFYAQTVCPFNKVIYKKGRMYYPVDLPFKYQGAITNQDIQNILNSQEFQSEVKRISANIVKTLKVTLKNGKIYFDVPLQTLLGEVQIKLNADIEVANNKIVLKNISSNSLKGFLNNDIIAMLIDKINPVSYEINQLNTKYCKIYITKAKISDNIINTEGIFTIKKNYNGEK